VGVGTGTGTPARARVPVHRPRGVRIVRLCGSIGRLPQGMVGTVHWIDGWTECIVLCRRSDAGRDASLYDVCENCKITNSYSLYSYSILTKLVSPCTRNKKN